MFDWLLGKNKDDFNFKDDNDLEQTLLKIYTSKYLFNVVHRKRSLGESYQSFIRLHKAEPPELVSFRYIRYMEIDIFYYWGLDFNAIDEAGLSVTVSGRPYYSHMPMIGQPVFQSQGHLCFKPALAGIDHNLHIPLFHFLPNFTTAKEIKKNLQQYIQDNLEQYQGALSVVSEDHRGNLSLPQEKGGLSIVGTGALDKKK